MSAIARALTAAAVIAATLALPVPGLGLRYLLAACAGLLAGLLARATASEGLSEEETRDERWLVPMGAALAGPQKTIMVNIGAAADEGPRVAWLVLPGDPPQTFLLSAVTSIGRGTECQIVIADPGVSPHHADIIAGPDGFRIIDKSRNGVYVNDQRVDAVDLVDHDTIRIADIRFVFKST